MPLILGTNSIKDTTFSVANSCRFNAGSSDSLTRTFGTPTNNRIWTYSFWMKHCDNAGVLLNTGADTSYMYFRGSSANPVPFGFSVEQYVSSFQYRLIPNEVFRDHSAWQHIVIAFDTTQSTASNRVKIYKNGSQITSFNTEDYPSQNLDTQVNSAVAHKIGGFASSGFYDGYLAEVVFIDGQQLDPTSFGEFDEDSPTIWKPKDVSGLTFGNNGFHLDFENASSLGADVSGNSNNFTVNNLTSVDQSTDTCTNNFATWNPLLGGNVQYANFSEGNLKLAGNDGSNAGTNLNSTIGASSGKYYMEIKAVDIQGTSYPGVGVIMEDDVFVSLGQVGGNPNSVSYRAGGTILTNGSVTDTESSYTDNDIIGIALDLDNGAVYFSKNGSFQNSGDPTSGSSRTGSLYNFTPSSKVYFFAATVYTTTAIISANFGSPSFSISSGNSDANGHGNFEYAVPSGYYALNTKNLAEFG
jgi:hypothetical protein